MNVVTLTVILLITLFAWAGTVTVVLVSVIRQGFKERVEIFTKMSQINASIRAEVQALTEALVRQGGGSYISPITRNQSPDSRPTEKWFEKRTHPAVVVASPLVSK